MYSVTPRIFESRNGSQSLKVTKVVFYVDHESSKTERIRVKTLLCSWSVSNELSGRKEGTERGETSEEDTSALGAGRARGILLCRRGRRYHYQDNNMNVQKI